MHISIVSITSDVSVYNYTGRKNTITVKIDPNIIANACWLIYILFVDRITHPSRISMNIVGCKVTIK